METTGTQVLTVKASALRVGDRLIATNRTVTHWPSRGIKTPSGKVDLGVDGFRATWNASTLIQVERKG